MPVWVTPVGADIRKVLSAAEQFDTNQNLGDSVAPGTELDISTTNRRDALLDLSVKEVRAVIGNAGRTPVSLTAGAVPAEGEWHTLVMAAWRLVNSTPGLAKSFLAGDGGAKTPLALLHDEAREWLADVGRGEDKYGRAVSVATPSDPVGRDGATAVSDDNPLYEAVRVGSTGLQTEVDLAPFSQTVDGIT